MEVKKPDDKNLFRIIFLNMLLMANRQGKYPTFEEVFQGIPGFMRVDPNAEFNKMKAMIEKLIAEEIIEKNENGGLVMKVKKPTFS